MMQNKVLDTLLGELTLENELYFCESNAFGEKIYLTLYPEELTEQSFKQILQFTHEVFPKISLVKINNLKYECATEITASAYSQSDYNYTEKDIDNLYKDMILSEIGFIEESIIFTFKSPKIFKNETLAIQVDETFETEDITIQN